MPVNLRLTVVINPICHNPALQPVHTLTSKFSILITSLHPDSTSFGKVVRWEVISGQESTPAITINLPVTQTTKTVSSDNDTGDDQGY